MDGIKPDPATLQNLQKHFVRYINGLLRLREVGCNVGQSRVKISSGRDCHLIAPFIVGVGIAHDFQHVFKRQFPGACGFNRLFTPDSFRSAPGRGSSFSAPSRFASTNRRLVR